MVLSKRLAITAACLILVLGFGSLASAQALVVTSEQSIYFLSDTIRITVENPTSETAWSICNNFWFLEETGSGDLIDGGCAFDDFSTQFAPGYTWTYTHTVLDLVLNNQAGAGMYAFGVYETGTGATGEPPCPQIEFEISIGTPNEACTWGALKAIYR